MKKRIIAIAALFCMIFNITAFAYNFPQPDWGTLLRERENMINEVDFELYTQGSVESAPYYGARLEPRGGTYIGMIAENSGKFKPVGSYLTYIQNMELLDFYYPANQMIANDNVIATVGWTIDDFGLVNYDSIRQALNTLNAYGKPMFIRFANEMNCSVLGDEPEVYKEIFRNVANMVHEYDNFATVWSPVDLGSLDRPFELYYPGDEYVDWVGLSCYMIKYFQGKQNTEYKESAYFMTGDYAWATNRVKPFMDFLEKNNIQKPVMISEGGVPTNNSYGEDLEWWATPRFRNMLYNLIMKYPQIKLINIFNTHRGGEVERFDISDYAYATNIYNEAKNSGAYITAYGEEADFVYQPASAGETLNAVDGTVPLYTLAHFPNSAYAAVNYYLDGEWAHSSEQIPYTYNLDVASLSDGEHTVAIKAFDQEKTYTFYKNGSSIRFGGEPEASIVPEAPTTPDAPAAPAEDEIKVFVDGVQVVFDQPPVIIDGRTLVPVRAIFNALGAEVEWIAETRTVVSKKDGSVVEMTIGENVFYVDGVAKVLDVPAQIINDRTLVPVRAISEAYFCDVEWSGAARTVYILTE